jgi:hypothetical protein
MTYLGGPCSEAVCDCLWAAEVEDCMMSARLIHQHAGCIDIQYSTQVHREEWVIGLSTSTQPWSWGYHPACSRIVHTTTKSVQTSASKLKWHLLNVRHNLNLYKQPNKKFWKTRNPILNNPSKLSTKKQYWVKKCTDMCLLLVKVLAIWTNDNLR